MIAKHHADKLMKVAAQLASERFGGWANPLVVDLTNAATFLSGGQGGSVPDPRDAVLSIGDSKEPSNE